MTNDCRYLFEQRLRCYNFGKQNRVKFVSIYILQDYIDKKKQNSQIHYVRIQDKSILLSVMENIKNLKDAFFLLIDATKIEFDEINEIIESNDADEDKAGSLQSDLDSE